MDFDEAVGYGKETPDFWLSRFDGHAGPTARSTSHSRRPIPTPSRRSTKRPVSLGAESLHAPRLWPEYHERYFGAFVRDPDGNNVEAVCHAG